jgi:hypothetical protein
MFNLEQSIADWRRQMLAAGIKMPVPLEELEIHLREEIGRLVKSGKDAQKAFEEAIQLIGKANMINNEFKKVKEPLEARFTKVVGIVFLVVISLAACCFSLLLADAMFLLHHYKIDQSSVATVGQLVSGFAAIAAFTLFAWSWRLCPGIFPAISKKALKIIPICGCVSLLFWTAVVVFRIVVPHPDATFGQVALLMWAILVPPTALGGLILGLDAAARKKAASAGS